MNRFDTAQSLKQVLAKVESAGLRADTQNPEETAAFPVCIVHPPLQRTKCQGAQVDLSFTVEVWAVQQFDALRLFDRVVQALSSMGLALTNNTPLFRDPIGKWRFGGYFECRFNAITNSLEPNR